MRKRTKYLAVSPNCEMEIGVGLGVDAGQISFADAGLYEEAGGEVSHTEGSTATYAVPNGRYLVQYVIERTFRGRVRGRRYLEITTGRLSVGDACYFFPSHSSKESSWSNFLDKTEYLESMGPRGFSVSTGGDGCFPVWFKLNPRPKKKRRT